VSRVGAENSTALTSACTDAEGLAQKIVLLEVELMVERWAWETSKRVHRESFEELTLLWTWGSELCLAFPTLLQPGNLSYFRWWCPLPRGWCSGAHPATLAMRRW
jgi:hypothetical protein